LGLPLHEQVKGKIALMPIESASRPPTGPWSFAVMSIYDMLCPQ
jgi:hypothetical protein